MESTPGIFLKGYSYFHDQFVEKDTDILQTRLFLKKAIVMKGEEAARIFYDENLFRRKGATPKRFKKTLLGEGGVQGLDGEQHYHRKKMFMQMMGPESIEKLEHSFEEQLARAVEDWEQKNTVILFEEMEYLLCKAACEWTGVLLSPDEVEKRTRLLSNLIDGSGGAGPRHWKGRSSRKKAEKWIMNHVSEVRKRENNPGNSILSAFSFHRDLKGKLLKKRIVAVEIVNLLRPIVAIARYITFAALALHENPQYRERLKKDRENLDLYFVQEVRRYYPFFPFVASKVQKAFEWRGVKFKKDQRVLLDIYATTHDENIWANAETFYAERFKDWPGSAFDFIPQGGGDHERNHRCAGEWITINLTRSALNFLVNNMEYTVPQQDLDIDLSRIPAIPKSRFKISNVRKKLQGIQVL